MQNVAQGTVSDSDKDTSSQNSESNLALGSSDKCQTYADLQDKFCTSSVDSDSEEEDISEVESFVLGEGDEDEEEPGNSSLINNKNKFLLGGGHASSSPTSVSYFCVGDCGSNTSGVHSLHHHHNHSQPQFDPDTQARLVALLEAAVSSSSDPEVLRRLTSSVSSALDEAAAALTRMRSDSASGAAAAAATAAVTVGRGTNSSNSCSSSSSTSSSGSNINSNSSNSGDSASSSRSSSAPGAGQRTLVEACTDGDVHTVRRLLDEGKSVHETTEEGESLLALTCSAGYFDLAQVLLAMRANVEDRGIKGDCTPLMEAASAGHVEIVKLLLAHNADVNAQSSSGNTPLMYACGGGHTQVVKVLLEHGAKVEDHNENGHTPLMEAASAGHVQVAKLLLEKGAGINTSSNEFKESALTLACYKGHLEMVKFLLDAGADQEHKTDEMHTALMEASMDGHVEVARLLLDSGAQVNMPADSFESPLTLAACGGHIELALLLLERGANIEEVNDEGYTPLMEAAREGHDEMVKLLIAHVADVDCQTEETQETALTLAACGGFKDVAQTLIQCGADLELGASTALMEAAQEGHKELVKYLLEVGCNPNSQTSTGDTALTYAAENGHTDVTAYLVRAGADIEHESEGGRAPLMKACRAGHFCTVQYLASQGADINKATLDNDHTPLSLACVGGHLRIVEYLLNIGADPNHKLKDNSTMLMEASKGGHTNVVKVLMDYPSSISHIKALTGETSRVVLEAEAMSTVVENSAGGGGVMMPASQQLALGLSVMPSIDQQTAPFLLNTGTSLLIPEIAPEAGIASSDAMMHLERGSKEGRKNIAAPQDRNFRRDDLLLDEDARGTAELLDVLKREEHKREEQILSKQHILEQLQRVEKQMSGMASAAPNSFSSVGRQMVYNTGSALSHNTHTVETQTGFLPSSAWTVLPSAIGMSDIAPTLKANNHLSPLYSGTSQPLPLAVPSDGLQIPTSYAASCQQDGFPVASSSPTVYLTPTSPTSVPTPTLSGTSSSSSASVPVQERRKMIPTKKQLDKKKLQLQQQQQKLQQQQQQLQHQLNSQQHQCILQQVEGTYNCTGNQVSVVASEGSISSPQGETPPCPLSQIDEVACESWGLEEEIPKGAKKDQKKAAAEKGHRECDCPVHDEDLDLEATFPERCDQVPTLTSLGTPLHLSSSGVGTTPSGIVSSQHLHFTPFQVGNDVSLHYGHLSTMNVNQGVATPSGSTPQPVSSVATEDVTQSIKNQAKQFLLQPPQVDETVGQRGTGLSPALQNLKFSPGEGADQNQFIQAQSDITSQVPCTKKSKKTGQVIVKPDLQQQPSNLSSLEQQQGISTAVNGLTLEPHNVIYENNMTHYPVSSANLQVQQGLMVATPATPAKILNDQLSDLSTTQASQMVPTQLGVPYTGSEASQVLYSGQTALCNCPSPIIDVDSETDSNHDTALTLACAGGHDELAQLLIARGSNIEHCDKKGFTPLILAATAGHAKVVEILLNHSANMEAQSERTKDTPLSLACSGGRFEVVEILLARGANKEHRNVSDYTPLSLAASGGYVNIIKLLLEHGAEINSRTGSKLGISPLMLAAMNGHVQAVKLLLDMGSDINAQIETNRNTALTLACFQGRSEVVSLLLDRKANVEHRAKTGLTPLMEAASGGYVDVGKVLIEKGADVNAPPVPSSRDTALTIAADKGHLKFVELLIKNGAQTEVKNKKGNSPMWLAANGGHLEVIQALLNSKTNINSEDNRKVSCLMSAFKKGHVKLVKFMVRHVSQFPSDQELDRYICTLNDEELRRKCKTCAEAIHSAKEKQAQEANKNADILLDLLEKEKSREETRKASAQRKKQKKKQKKQEKKEERKRIKEEEEDKKTQKTLSHSSAAAAAAAAAAETEAARNSENLKSSSRGSRVQPSGGASGVRMEASTSEDKDGGDSGIDSNSQTSASSETKVAEKSSSISKKKQKKKKDVPEQNPPNPPNPTAPDSSVKRRKNQNISAESTTKSNGVSVSNKDFNSSLMNYQPGKPSLMNYQPGKPSLVNYEPGKPKKRRENENKAVPDLSDLNVNMYLDMKPVGGKKNQDVSSRINALDTFGEVDLYISSLTNNNAATMSPSTRSQLALGTSPKKLGRREDGWKEVSRKAKRVSVPNNAISRVIGRGGCNINTIREASGAHIEVEKQGKSQGDRMIIIKGSTEATRQAQNLINALVKDPDKDLSELLPKSVIKVPPKISKAQPLGGDLTTAQIGKITRLTSAVAADTASAKSAAATSSAWSNIASPRRTPLSNLNRQVPTHSGLKSPAVRQLFPGEKKGTLTHLPSNMKATAALPSLLADTPQTFASKLSDNKLPPRNMASQSRLMAKSTMPGARKDGMQNEVPAEHKSRESLAAENNQYSIFNNFLSQVTQQVAFGNKEKTLNFARAASEGLACNKVPLGQQPQLSHMPYLEHLENKPVVDASRAPGYRGTISNSSIVSLSMKPTINFHSGALSSLASSTSTIMKSADSASVSASLGSNINQLSSIANATSLANAISGNSLSTDMASRDPILNLSSSVGSSSAPHSGNCMARSAPGTPIASPSLRPIGPVSNSRQTATPPPVTRPSEFLGQVPFSSYGPSRTPPPIMPSLMRLQVAPPPLSSANIQSHPHISSPGTLASSFASPMYISSPPSTLTSIASLAPGGPVSSHQRAESSDFVNLAVGQPYRKQIQLSEIGLVNSQPTHQLHSQHQQQNALQQQVLQQQVHHSQRATQQVQQQQIQPQHQSQMQQSYQQQQVHQHFPQSIAGHLALMNGIRFTTPQSNTQPVFTNNIMATITAAPHIQSNLNPNAPHIQSNLNPNAPHIQSNLNPNAPHIQSNLNPNAPDFSSRTQSYVPGNYTHRSQLTSYQNGIPSATPSIYSGVGLGQFAGSIDSGMHMQPGISDVMGLMPRNNLSSGGVIPSSVGSMTLRTAVMPSQDGATPINSPHSSSPSSPTQSTTTVTCGTPTDDRHSKLQPIGTERAQKRSVAPPPSAGMGVGGEFLWARQDILPQQSAAHQQVEPILQPPSMYYPHDLDLPSYNGPMWNWATDTNR